MWRLIQLVVLAGGLGTRLRGAIPEGLPKAMAPIAGRPFLEHLLDRAISEGVSEVLLLVGYSAQAISRHFGDNYRGLPVAYSIEDIPLGTGGALKAAETHLADKFVLVNGDTFADVSYRRLMGTLGSGTLSMSLAHIEDASRYGCAETEGGVVVGLKEKGISGPGKVNAGVYACRRELITIMPDSSSFSFEKDFLEPRLSVLRPPFLGADSGIIDIGTPESYVHANNLHDRARGPT